VLSGWLALVALVTAGLWGVRSALDKSHMAMAYLLLVLGASARHGGRLGLALAVVCFLSFNFFLLPPYYTFAIAQPLDWFVLFTFLVTAAVAAQLLDTTRSQAAAAQQRADEIDRLSTLGAETLNAPGAEEAVQAIARVLRDTLGVGLCEIHGWNAEQKSLRLIGSGGETDPEPTGGADELLRYVAQERAAVVVRTDRTTHVASRGDLGVDAILTGYDDARVFLIPLEVRGAVVGVLRLADPGAIHLGDERARFAGVLSYYAALGLERVRLGAEEARAKALKEEDRLKDALLASVSHDLRTPLTTIKALAYELRATGDERVVSIEREADRLNRLVADLLDLSRIRGGGLPLKLEINAADDLVGAALAGVRGLPGASAIRAEVKSDEGVLLGRFDFVQALRALTNLLENALKHCGGQPVELKVGRVGDRLLFRVLDRGPGVPAEETERIFEPFYKAPGSPSTGAGLGLAIARRSAEAQGGAVRLESRPGGGSVFTLDLAAADVTELPA
jgi:two-component system sensor histidine kinase KdpD